MVQMLQDSAFILLLFFFHTHASPLNDPPDPKLGFLDNMKLKAPIWTTSGLMETAKRHFSYRDFHTAIKFVSRAIELKPYKASYYEFLSECHAECGEYGAAFQDLKTAYEIVEIRKETEKRGAIPDFRFTPTILSEYGERFMRWNEYESAVWFYTKAIELRPREVSYYKQRGKCYSVMRKVNLSISDFERAMMIDQHDPDLGSLIDQTLSKAVHEAHLLDLNELAYVGNRLMQTRRFREAINFYIGAIVQIRKYPENMEYYRTKGICHIEMGDLDLAILDFSTYLSRNPNDISTWIKLVEICASADKLNVAMEEIRTYLDPYKIGEIAKHFSRQKMYPTAIALLTEAIKKNPHTSWYFTERGNCYLEMKDLNTAILDFELATDLEPQNWEQRFRFSNLLYEADRYDEAIREIRASNVAIQTFLNMCHRFRMDNKLQGAISCYTAAIEKFPEKDILFKERGECYRKLKIFDQAISDLMQAVELNQNNADTQVILDEVLREAEAAPPSNPNVQPIPQNIEPVTRDIVVFDPAQQTANNENKEVKKLASNKYLQDLLLLELPQTSDANFVAEIFPPREPSQAATENQNGNQQTRGEDTSLDLMSFNTVYPTIGSETLGSRGMELVPVTPMYPSLNYSTPAQFYGTQGMELVPVASTNPFSTDYPNMVNAPAMNYAPVVSPNPFNIGPSASEQITSTQGIDLMSMNPFDMDYGSNTVPIDPGMCTDQSSTRAPAGPSMFTDLPSTGVPAGPSMFTDTSNTTVPAGPVISTVQTNNEQHPVNRQDEQVERIIQRIDSSKNKDRSYKLEHTQ